VSDNLFICESCGSILPDDCPRCPDRGNGKGYTVRQIKDAIKRCRTHGDVSDCRKHFARHIVSLKRKRGDAAVMAIQIENLVQYQCNGINAGAV